MNMALQQSTWGVTSERAAARQSAREERPQKAEKKGRKEKVREQEGGCHPLVGQWGSGQCNQLLTFSLNHFCITSEWPKNVFADGYERTKCRQHQPCKKKLVSGRDFPVIKCCKCSS